MCPSSPGVHSLCKRKTDGREKTKKLDKDEKLSEKFTIFIKQLTFSEFRYIRNICKLFLCPTVRCKEDELVDWCEDQRESSLVEKKIGKKLKERGVW